MLYFWIVWMHLRQYVWAHDVIWYGYWKISWHRGHM